MFGKRSDITSCKRPTQPDQSPKEQPDGREARPVL